ncbi:hypothetical protein AAG570_014059 [Ranatra chinensis]|uniref:Tripartite tricarboxylate transporter substrate binding protein n=1 Tax=Ranatra chinensis TaxID=642074 RepID=A0ABD0YE06_9HEMI
MFKKSYIFPLIMAICCCLIMIVQPASAKEWPSKPITVVVPYAAGGDGDLTARLWADFAEKKLGQPILVVNKVGGGGMTGTNFAAKSSPDGYTLFLAQAGPVLLTPNMTKTTYSFDSFDYVSRIFVGNCALVVHSSAPWNNLTEFFADAKANPNKYSFASPGSTTWLSFAIRDLVKKAEVDFKFVEFQGGAPAVTAVLGEHATFTFCFPQNYATQLKAGNLKVLGIAEETPDVPGVKSFADQGFQGSYYGWAGIAAPKGVPAPILEKLDAITKEISADPDFIAKAKNMQATPAYLSQSDWLPVLQEQNQALGKVLEELGLKK